MLVTNVLSREKDSHRESPLPPYTTLISFSMEKDSSMTYGGNQEDEEERIDLQTFSVQGYL